MFLTPLLSFPPPRPPPLSPSSHIFSFLTFSFISLTPFSSCFFLLSLLSIPLYLTPSLPSHCHHPPPSFVALPLTPSAAVVVAGETDGLGRYSRCQADIIKNKTRGVDIGKSIKGTYSHLMLHILLLGSPNNNVIILKQEISQRHKL